MPDSTERAPFRLGVPTPYLRVDDANRAIGFYRAVFGAEEVVRLTEPGGRVAHAELRMGEGGSPLMLSDEYPESGIRGPAALGGTTVALQVFVKDDKAVFAAAVAAGGTVLKDPVLDPFGDLAGKLQDPFGHEWLVSTQVEALSAAEMVSRFRELMGETDRGAGAE
jgi:PhnB protein